MPEPIYLENGDVVSIVNRIAKEYPKYKINGVFDTYQKLVELHLTYKYETPIVLTVTYQPGGSVEIK